MGSTFYLLTGAFHAWALAAIWAWSYGLTTAAMLLGAVAWLLFGALAVKASMAVKRRDEALRAYRASLPELVVRLSRLLKEARSPRGLAAKTLLCLAEVHRTVAYLLTMLQRKTGDHCLVLTHAPGGIDLPSGTLLEQMCSLLEPLERKLRDGVAALGAPLATPLGDRPKEPLRGNDELLLQCLCSMVEWTEQSVESMSATLQDERLGLAFLRPDANTAKRAQR